MQLLLSARDGVALAHMCVCTGVVGPLSRLGLNCRNARLSDSNQRPVSIPCMTDPAWSSCEAVPLASKTPGVNKGAASIANWEWCTVVASVKTVWCLHQHQCLNPIFNPPKTCKILNHF